MNAITPQFQQGAVSSVFANQTADNDLSSGVQSGFGIIKYRGKVWSTQYRGEEQQLMREDGDGPRNSIEIVILKAANVVSKIWYENGWTEGSSAAPDCYSTNGMVPAAGAARKQHSNCAACPKNQWGSRITPQGKQGKACQDSKRLAVVPLNDIPNEIFKGPMLMRVPAASLQDLASFGETMKKMGYPYYSIGVRVSFDAAESYPKLVFSAIRPLTDAEAKLVIDMQNSPEVARILASEEGEHAPVEQVQTPASVFEQPPAQPAPQAPPAQPKIVTTTGFGHAVPQTNGVPVTQAAPAPTPAAAPSPAPAAPIAGQAPTPSATKVEQDLDAALDQLLA